MTSLSELVTTSERVAATASRLEKITLLAQLLRRLQVDEVEIAVSYLTGDTGHARLGVGPASMFVSAAPRADGESPALLQVHAALAQLGDIAGAGSVARRKQQLGQLLALASSGEQAFLRRLLVGELRQGALEGVMLEAIARAADLPVSAVRRAALVGGGLPAVAHAALSEGSAGLQRFALTLFRPLLPMLAQPAADIDEALHALGTAALEWKLDGVRIQVHKDAKEVRVYTRNLNDVTAAVPEVVDAVRGLQARTLILDGEVIALQPNAAPHPFQVTMRRFGRRREVDVMRTQLPLSSFFFDLLHADGDDLIERGGAQRSELLHRLMPAALCVPRTVTDQATVAQAFLDGALHAGHEGVMAKSLSAPYEAGGRGRSWLKIKQAHTLDLVVLAAEWGNGRRRGWLSNLHLGAYDPDSGGFVMLGKTFKGLTDEMLAWQTAQLLALERAREGVTVYVQPRLVVEIAVNEIQYSPHYPAGMALRFARVKRYRSDKQPEQADTLTTVRELFERTAQGMDDAL